MPELLRMPSVAAGAEEATLSSWAIDENTGYRASDVIATIETAKAAVDVEAEADGVLLKTLVEPGTDVRVGDAIALIGRPGETVAEVDAALAELGVTPAAPAPGQDHPDRSTEPEASGPGETSPRETGPTKTSTTETSTASPSTTQTSTAEPGTAETSPGVSGDVPAGAAHGRVFASPLARRLARDSGLSFDGLAGSGPNGRITRRDVEQALSRPAPAPAAVPAASGPAHGTTSAAGPVAAPRPGAAASYTEVPHSRLRQAIARRLTESQTSVPHFYLRGSARVGQLLALRAELNETAAAKISVNDLILKAVAGAHQAVPAANVTWTPEAMRQYGPVDLGVAIAVPAGLVTPVLRGVDQLSISAVAAATRELAARARDGRLKQSELEGGAMAVTNLGMFGTEEFAAIINPPQSAILAVGAARREPVVTASGKLKAAMVLHVTLSVDHRAIDGALAAEWMGVFTQILENPLRILL
jgi:pyruvate dehydrogenase E2 component (dihydrolipoamide acetyltransferase)